MPLNLSENRAFLYNPHETVGICGGYFAPLHAGHIEYINEAKKHCSFLIVVVNNDLQAKLKGAEFMDEESRRVIINNLKSVSYTVLAIDTGPTICKTLNEIVSELPENRIVLFNSGDRSEGNRSEEEEETCKRLGIDTLFLDLPKKDSSRNYRNDMVRKG